MAPDSTLFPHPEGPVFSLRAVRCGYGGRAVLRALDLLVEPGDSLGVLGSSGEGKTLLLKVLAGLMPYEGSVKFFGQELRTMSPAQRAAFRDCLGMTFQKDGLFDSMTCGDNLRFPLRERLGVRGREADKRVAAALESVGLSGQGDLFVHEMSGGMQKRLGIARALLFSPQVVLYDEPSAGLDPITSRSINELLAEVRLRHAMTVVLVTSDLAQAEQLCPRLAFLWKGQFEQTGTPAALRRSSNAAVHQFFNTLAEGPLTEGVA